jgi:hypothetical protein
LVGFHVRLRQWRGRVHGVGCGLTAAIVVLAVAASVA